MRPFLLMDKSTVQGLSLKHFEYINRYYSHVISPILLRELTSNLAKENKDQSDSELKKLVSYLSEKSNSPSSYVLPDALKMAYNNFFDWGFVPMDGRIPLEGGKQVRTIAGQSGIVFDEPSENQLLRNWTDGIFSKKDLNKGKEIRKMDSSVDMEAICNNASQDLADLPNFESLKELVAWVDKVHFSPANPEQLVLNTADYILAQNHAELLIFHWEQQGRPKLEKFAPYALYFYRMNDPAASCGVSFR